MSGGSKIPVSPVLSRWLQDRIQFLESIAPPPQILVMDADGHNLKQLTANEANYPAWSPDGKDIVCTDARRKWGRFLIMKADGSNKR